MRRKIPNGLSEQTYNKYVKPSIDREKKIKGNRCKKWWAENWIGLSGLILAIISLAISIIALLN